MCNFNSYDNRRKAYMRRISRRDIIKSFFSPHIVPVVVKAASKYLILLLVYNACGWERVEILKILDRHNNY
jgi:hypothetical protein